MAGIGDNYEEDVIVEDVENYQSGKDNKYSHQVLIMKVLEECIKAGCEEPLEGGAENKLDKSGNMVVVRKPDTRKKFIACVETAMNFMDRDYDGKEKIAEIEKERDDNKQKWLKLEWTWWNSLPYEVKKQKIAVGQNCIQGEFNINNSFFNNYLFEDYKIMRKILTELNRLTKRINDYEAEDLYA